MQEIGSTCTAVHTSNHWKCKWQILHLYRFIEFTANKIKWCQTYTDLKITIYKSIEWIYKVVLNGQMIMTINWLRKFLSLSLALLLDWWGEVFWRFHLANSCYVVTLLCSPDWSKVNSTWDDKQKCQTYSHYQN